MSGTPIPQVPWTDQSLLDLLTDRVTTVIDVNTTLTVNVIVAHHTDRGLILTRIIREFIKQEHPSEYKNLLSNMIVHSRRFVLTHDSRLLIRILSYRCPRRNCGTIRRTLRRYRKLCCDLDLIIGIKSLARASQSHYGNQT